MITIRTLASLMGVLLLSSACGGESTTSSGSAAPPPAGNAITKILTSNDLTAVLPGVGSADFSSSPTLSGATVEISIVADSEINSLANEYSALTNARIDNAETIKITIDRIPPANVQLRLNYGRTANRIGAADTPTVFAISLMETSANTSDDGGDNMLELNGRFLHLTNELLVELPDYFFQNDRGKFSAFVKIANFISTKTSSAASSSKLAAEARDDVVLPCPLAPPPPPMPLPIDGGIFAPINILNACVETSRFNTVRYLNTPSQRARPHAHLGADFRARSPSDIYVPSGGKIELGSSFNFVRRGTGISLTIKYPDFKIRVLHLSAINANLLLPGGLLNSSYVTNRNDVIGLTGETGIPGAPHLHFELWKSVTFNCRIISNEEICATKFVPIDPFPPIANIFTAKVISQQTLLDVGVNFRFAVTATDKDGAEVLSNVQNARENNGRAPSSSSDRIEYDPTRKICMNANGVTSIRLPASNGNTIFSGVNGSICVPWGAELAATGLALQPDVILDFRYSREAAQPVANDPQSEISAQVFLTRDQTNCLSLRFVRVGDSCVIFGFIALEVATDISRIMFVSDNPQIAATSVILFNPGAGPPLAQLRVVAGSRAGTANLVLSIDGVRRGEFAATNDARTD